MRIALIIPDSPAWKGAGRSDLFRRLLEGDGHTVAIFPVVRDGCPGVNELRPFDMVCNHAMQAPPEKLRPIAEALPGTTFLHVNHSAIPHLERIDTRFVDRLTASLHSARQVPNVWYVSQDAVADDIGKAAGIDRCMWLPTPGHVLEPRAYRPPAERPKVIIAGRSDPIKNNLIQLIACGMLRDSIELVLCLTPDATIKNTLRALDMPTTIKGLLPHSEWIEYLRSAADAVLCCSLAESYGFVAAEAMQSGVPVVASNAIRFAHPELTVAVNTPAMVASRIELAIDCHQRLAAESAEMASREARTQVSEYLRRIAAFV